MIPSHAHDDDAAEVLRARLAEAEDMLQTIRHGEIDALVVEGAAGHQVYTLHSAEEPYRNLVEEMQEGAVVLTGRGDILYSNARFAALVGAPLESAVGARIDRFVHPSERDDFETLLAGGAGRRRSRLIASDSGVVDVSLSLTTTAATNGRRLNLIVTDLSELLEAAGHRDRAERGRRAREPVHDSTETDCDGAKETGPPGQPVTRQARAADRGQRGCARDVADDAPVGRTRRLRRGRRRPRPRPAERGVSGRGDQNECGNPHASHPFYASETDRHVQALASAARAARRSAITSLDHPWLAAPAAAYAAASRAGWRCDTQTTR